MSRNPLALAFALSAALALGVPASPALASEPLTRHAVSVSQADRMIAAAADDARTRGLEVSIVVVDAAGDIVAGHRMDGSGPVFFEVARRKAVTSALFRANSKNIEDNIINGLKGSGAFMGAIVLDDIMPRQGGLPIRHGQETIGAIGISGAAPDVDELIAQAGLNAIAMN